MQLVPAVMSFVTSCLAAVQPVALVIIVNLYPVVTL